MRTLVLFYRTGSGTPALANATYPSTLSSAESVAHHPGSMLSWPAVAKVTRAAGGVTCKIKFQGTLDGDPLILGGGGASYLGIAGRVPGLTIRLQQQTGASQAIGHSLSGGALTLLLPTNSAGRPSGTPDAAGTYIGATAALANFVATGGGAQPLLEDGLTHQVPMVQSWVDITSWRQSSGAEQVEHTLDAGAGNTVSFAFVLRSCLGFRAIRCIGAGTGAPDPDDALLVTMAAPGGRLEA